MKITNVDVRFECPFMRNSIFGDSIPLKHRVEEDKIYFEYNYLVPLHYGKFKITYTTDEDFYGKEI